LVGNSLAVIIYLFFLDKKRKEIEMIEMNVPGTDFYQAYPVSIRKFEAGITKQFSGEASTFLAL